MATTTKAPLSWDPVLSADGKTYCAPACGGRCTRHAWIAAKAAASAMCAGLGAGWAPKVWENLGWFYKAVHAASGLEVYGPMRAPGTYWCTTTWDDLPQFQAHAAMPRTAVESVKAQVAAAHDRLTRAMVSAVGV